MRAVRGRATSPQTYPGDEAVLATRKKRDLPAQGVARGNNGYELNFADAELSELAKVILRDTLGQAYVFDPRVQGRVTISTGGPVSREEILSILESVLAMHRGALITDGNLYKIVPEAEARQKVSIAIDYNGERKEVGRRLRHLHPAAQAHLRRHHDTHAVLACEPGPAARQPVQ